MDWYFEDVQLSHKFVGPGRTVTEADNTFFCMLTGDWNPAHCDAEAAKHNRFGQRVVAGMFGMTLINGALHQWAVFERTGLAMLGVREWKFLLPIFIDDTLTVEMQVDAKRLTSRGDAGLLERRFTLRNQHGEVVQLGWSDMLVRLRPAVAESPSLENHS